MLDKLDMAMEELSILMQEESGFAEAMMQLQMSRNLGSSSGNGNSDEMMEDEDVLPYL